MKQAFLIVLFLPMAILLSCSKDQPAEPSGNNLQFISLTATDTIIKVNGLTTLTASAKGDGIVYNWSANYGTFIGSGAQVQWTVCHKDKFTINCKVTDSHNQSQTKQIVIHSQY